MKITILRFATPFFFIAAAVHAQPLPPEFQPYFNSADYGKSIGAKVIVTERALGTGCNDPKPLRHELRAILERPVFNKDGMPSAGAWIDRTDVDRCGKHVFENILVAFVDGKQKLAALLPGTTRASPLLQRDAITTAHSTASVKQLQAEKAGAAPCSDKTAFAISETRFERERVPIKSDASGKMTAGAWDEIWIFQVCGREIPVVIHFDADGKGGTNFNTNPRE